jgi:predicted RNase H-like HicB family nuclease
MPSHLKLIVEKHSDGYVAYPLGISRGAILGQGDSYENALADVRSAIAFHVQTFGEESLAPGEEGPVLEAFVAEVAL